MYIRYCSISDNERRDDETAATGRGCDGGNRRKRRLSVVGRGSKRCISVDRTTAIGGSMSIRRWKWGVSVKSSICC